MDALFELMIDTNTDHQKGLQIIIQFVQNNEYDSDALKEDLDDDAANSNLFNVCDNHTKLILMMRQFIINVNRMFMSLCFSF